MSQRVPKEQFKKSVEAVCSAQDKAGAQAKQTLYRVARRPRHYAMEVDATLLQLSPLVGRGKTAAEKSARLLTPGFALQGCVAHEEGQDLEVLPALLLGTLQNRNQLLRRATGAWLSHVCRRTAQHWCPATSFF